MRLPSMSLIGTLLIAWSHQAFASPSHAARAHLAAHAADLSLQRIDLVPAVTLSTGGFATVRFAQLHRGLPVVDGSVAVRVDPNGAITLVVADVDRVLPDVAPTIAPEQALARSGVDDAARANVALVITGGRLVWRVEAPSFTGGVRFDIDAHDGQLLAKRKLASYTLGRVYPIHPLATPETRDLELSGLLPVVPQRLSGWGDNLVVTRFVYGGAAGGDRLEQYATANVGEDFLHDPPVDVTNPSDAFAEVNGYYHLSRARMEFESLGVDMSSPDWRLVAAVNVLDTGQPFDGAFYSPAGLGPPWDAPNFLAFGQGQWADFAYDADAYYHEFTHYVNHRAVAFNAGQFAFDEQGLSPFSIAIDEGVADYFACSIAGDPVVGEASLATIGKQRDLSGEPVRCPADIGGEPHLDGMLIGGLGWTLRERFGRDIADRLMWTATTLLPYRATFADFARGVLQGAKELEQIGELTSEDMAAIEDALQARGLNDCDRSIRVPPGEKRTTLVFGMDSVGQILDTTCGDLLALDASLPSIFQFASGGGARGLRFDVKLEPAAPGPLRWSMLVRAHRPVGFEIGDTVPAPVARHYDYAVEGIVGTAGSIVIDEHSDPPFDPAASYYLVITHRNCPGVVAGIAAESLPAEVGGGPKGIEAPEPSAAGGCGCRIGPGRSAGGFCWVGLLLLAASCRRVSRRPTDNPPRDRAPLRPRD